MSKYEIIEKASALCEEYDINTYPVDIVNLCNKNGITVFEEYLPTHVSGFIIIQSQILKKYNTNKLIVVNLLDAPSRRRFTIAHELGHYVLHRQHDVEMYAHRDAGQNNSIEREANIFASNVLMPKYLVQKELDNISFDYWESSYDAFLIYKISNAFAVSEAAARVRLNELNKLNGRWYNE